MKEKPIYEQLGYDPDPPFYSPETKEELRKMRNIDTDFSGLVYRYRLDKELLEKHPENKEFLEKRINRHKDDIINLVISDEFLEIFHNRMGNKRRSLYNE